MNNYEINDVVFYKSQKFLINKFVSPVKVVISNSTSRKIVDITDIISLNQISNKNIPPDESEENIAKGEKRFDAVKKLLTEKLDKTAREKLAKEYGVSVATLYRWREIYLLNGTLTSLIPTKKNGGRNKSRLDSELETIIQEEIQHYFSKQKITQTAVIKKIKLRCYNEDISPPGDNTIRRRIKSLGPRKSKLKRFGKQAAEQHFDIRSGKYSDPRYPLDIVQIDHTPLDIIVVDEKDRKHIGRPYLTIASDLYSKCVTGLYISLDPPGGISAGLCISNSILDKVDLLDKLNIKGKWNVWGVMNTIHLDNAGEFRGKLVERACKEYGINVYWRALGKTHWGGTIERYIKTLNFETHNLPGTTFSDTKKRRNYSSEKEAAFTLFELEALLIDFIVNIYHKRNHSTLGMPPEEKWNEGIFGNGEIIGCGPHKKVNNKSKVHIDFLPAFESTIQSYGIQKDLVRYSSELLASMRAVEDKGTKHTFKRDPRDISQIYLWHKDLEEYIAIPYHNLSHPPISIWEFRRAKKIANEKYPASINEDHIFEAYNRQVEKVDSAISKTKKKRKERSATSSQKIEIKSTPTYDSFDLDGIDEYDTEEL